MIRKLVFAAFCLMVGIGIAVADEYNATLTKVDGNKITVQKYKAGKKGQKGEKDGDPITIAVAKDAKIAKGTHAGKGKFEVGDAIEGGLKSEILTKATEEKGVQVRVTTDADNKNVTQLLVVGKKKAAQ